MIRWGTAFILGLGCLALYPPAWGQLQGEYYDGVVLWDQSENNVYKIVFSHRDVPIDFRVETGNQWEGDVHDPDDPGLPGPPDYPNAEVNGPVPPGANGFCVRWRGQVMIPTAGDYTFYTTVKDGVRFYIDNIADGQHLLPDRWANNGLATYSYAVTGLSAGKHEIRMDYVNRAAVAEARLLWSGPGISQQIIPAANLLPPAHGLIGEYYNSTNYDPGTLVKTRYDRDVNWWWAGNMVDEGAEEIIAYNNFTVKWRGMIEVLVTGDYTFRVLYDDNGYLIVNGVTLITDNGTDSGEGGQYKYSSQALSLTAGHKYRIELGLREHTGDAGCRLYWKRSSQPSYSLIPTAQLYPYLSPTDILLSPATLAENAGDGALVGVLSTEPAGGDYTFALVSGAGDTDNSLFYVDGNNLRAHTSLDYEDVHGPVYSVRILTTDTSTDETLEKSFTINLIDVNESPTDIGLSNNAVAENLGPSVQVGVFTTADPDAGQQHTYSLVAGTGDDDNAAFQIIGAGLWARYNLDFEQQSVYHVRVRTQDNGTGPLTYEKAFTIYVIDIAEPITDIALSNATIEENAGANAWVGILTTNGAGAGYTYSLVSGEGSQDNALFNILVDALRANASLNYEAKSTCHVRIRSVDTGNPAIMYEKAFVISVVDVNETPLAIELSSASIYENAGPNAVVGSLSCTDPDIGQIHTYTLVSGAGDDDNSLFNINGLILRASVSLDFETQPTRHVRVRATDSGSPGLMSEQTFTITVLDVAEAPTAIALSNTFLEENAGANAVVGVFSTSGVGENWIYTLVSGEGGEDNGAFTIVGDELHANASLNYEERSSYSIRVQSRDNGTPPQTFTKVFAITVLDLNETPTGIGLSSQSLKENAGTNAVVGMLSTTDPDDGQVHFYELVTGEGDTANALFNINGTTLRASGSFDFESGSSYSIRIQTMDNGGLSYARSFTITITDVNEAPTGIALSSNALDENLPPGTAVGSLSTTDPDTGQSHIYTLVSGAGSGDNRYFSIVGNMLQANSSFDFENDAIYTIRVQSQDNGNPPLSYSQSFLISINNVNETPTAILLSNRFLYGTPGAGEYVGTLSTIDPDNPWSGQQHTYTLVESCDPPSACAGNSYFTILGGNKLYTGPAFNPLASPFNILVRSTDNGTPETLFVEETFVITVGEIPGAPAVSSIRLLDANPTSSRWVRFLVLFNKPVANVETGETPPIGGFNDFAVDLRNKAIQYSRVTAVIGGNAMYIVWVDTGIGDGILGLTVLDTGGIQDLSTPEPLPMAGPYSSIDAYIIDKESLTITMHPVGGTKAVGDSHTFSVAVTGAFNGIAHYQWKHADANVGPDSKDLVLKPLTYDDEGWYRCEVTDGWEIAVSNAAYLHIVAAVPLMGMAGMAALAAALTGIAALRRRR